jgi:predicted metal-dependent phosphoesterase TrpH
MRIDLHCHTRYSRDSLMSFQALVRWMDRRGLDKVAITDHNTMAGARDFSSRAPERFLIGEEIKSTHGDLIAFFIQEEVPPGLSPEETVDRVHDQGGLVGAAHPLDQGRGTGLGAEMLETLHLKLDFIEVFNARIHVARNNLRAREMASRWGLPGSAGSDAHAPFEVGRAYVEMPAFDGPGSFLESLAQGKIVGRASSPLVHFASRYAVWRKLLGQVV